jgi:myo-inositol-1(or 4)-monophosphatase
VKPEEWERLLLDATEKVMGKVERLALSGDRGRSVGIGASGDKTLRADKVAEDELKTTLLRVKGTKILSEEAGLLGDPDSETLAVVDPIDGSSNFERGIPFYCTAVAVVEGSSLEDVTVGVVRDLVRGDVYHAVRGRGTKKNGRRVRTSEVTELSGAVIGVDMSRAGPGLVATLAPIVGGARRQVHFGANALELCYVADRTIDAFVDLRGSIRITDLAAAYLVAAEAGAEITDAGGRRLKAEFDLDHRLSFVASANLTLHKEMLRLCQPLAQGRR